MPSRFVPSFVTSDLRLLRSAPLALAVLVGIVGHSAAAAGPKVHPPATGRVDPVVLTLSGGSSLGAYQGGLSFTLLSYMRLHQAALDANGEPLAKQPNAVRTTGHTYTLEAATGTSAGAANATAGALVWCSRAERMGTIRDNLYLDLWMPADIEALLPATADKYAPTDGLLSTRPMQPGLSALVRTLYGDGFVEGCDLPVGFAVTRSTPARLAVGDTLEFSTSQYVATFHLGTGPNGSPSLQPHPPQPGSLIARDLVFPTRQGEIDKTNLIKAVRASTAIPTVFASELLSHCVSAEEVPPGETLPEAPGCPTDRPFLRQDTFADGGIFDRVPISVAVDFADQKMSGWSWQRRGKLSYITADPMQIRWELAQPQDPDSASQGLAALLSFTSDFVVVARQTELLALYQQRRLDEGYERLVQINRGFPVYGRYLGNFGATLDKGFRSHDYIEGIYEALLYLAQRTWSDQVAALGKPRAVPPTPVGPFDCAPAQLPPMSSPEAVACAVPRFMEIGEELGFDADDELTGMLGELLRWELQRRMAPEVAAQALAGLKGWPFVDAPGWQTSPVKTLHEAVRHADSIAKSSHQGTDLSAFMALLIDLKGRGYAFEHEELGRDPEAYLYRIARRGLARLEELEREEQRKGGEAKTLGQRLTLGAIRTANAAVPAPVAKRDAPERKRSGADVLLPNYLDFNLFQGGINIGYETPILDIKPLGISASWEPLAWKRTAPVGWQTTFEAGWNNAGFNRVTAVRAGAFVQSAYLQPDTMTVGLRVSARFFANRVQVGVEAPMWRATGGLPRLEGWPNSIEVTLGVVDIRGVARLGSPGGKRPQPASAAQPQGDPDEPEGSGLLPDSEDAQPRGSR